MTDVTAPNALTRRISRCLPLAGLVLAAIAVLLLASAPLGWRAGWWQYGVSLQEMMPWAAYIGLAAAVVSLLALMLGLLPRVAIGRSGAALAVVALIAGGVVAYVPWHYRAVGRSVPRIDDITTDSQDPPAFIAVIPAREAEHSNPAAYAGAKLAAQQKEGYPDLAPITLPLAPENAFALALSTAKDMGWTIVATDPAQGRIEASDRSFWMGFTDDIVLRIAAAGSGSRVDMRSASRHGRSDLGVNAARIHAYFVKLRVAAGQS